MSIKLMTMVWDESPYDGSALLMHLALADYANDHGYCWPAVPTLAKKIKRTERHATRLLTKMEEDKTVERVIRPGTSNMYCVTRPDRWQADPTPMSPTPDAHVTPPPTPMSDDPSLNHHEPFSLSEKTKAVKPQPPTADPFEVSLYYKNKDHVRAIGNWTKGPWEVKCFHCGEGVRIKELDTPAECLCGMHEYTLTKKREEVEIEKENEAVAAYFLITGRKRGTIAQEWLDEIAEKVTDLSFWRQVVKEYCGKGWNRGEIAKMLKYYEEGRLPGTRKKKEQDGPKVMDVDGVRTRVYEEEEKGPKVKEVDGRRVRVYD